MLTAQRDAVDTPKLRERLLQARDSSDALFQIVRSDALYERPIPERHRIIFYIGHLEAFDWNLLHDVLGNPQSTNRELDRLFAFGIDPVGGGLPQDAPSDWPRLEIVRDYVHGVRDALDDRLENAIRDSESHAQDGFSLITLLNVAVEHRLMHVETLAYMLHQLPLPLKTKPAVSSQPVGSPGRVTPGMIEIPAGSVSLGLRRNGEQFGWDNEFEAHTEDVPAFQIDQYKVSNRQYLEFMAAGGYENSKFWSETDWNWKVARGISNPLFWKKNTKGDGFNWLWRTMFDEVALPLDWPVYVSQAEATAYARWAGKSLPTEAQWQRSAHSESGGVVSDRSRRNDELGRLDNLDKPTGNFDLRSWDPVPVNTFPEDQSGFGVHGMAGNGWEWTSTVFAPFPGFEPFPFYRGYSADFFDGKHFVMKGGSSRTAACMLRPTFRNWFQAHYQNVYAGFRCVNSPVTQE